jgi:TonB family protein
MTSRLIYVLALLLLHVAIAYAQTTSQPFAAFERAVKEQRGGWAGDQSQLSSVFNSERRQLGDKFEAELLKWLGNDVEKHYWISFYLEDNGYLQGNKRLPHLALLVKEQGLSLAREKTDEESQGYVVGLSVTAATLSAELGLSSLASSYKNEAETLLKSNPDLSAHVPAMYEAERARYDAIPSRVIAPRKERGPSTTPAGVTTVVSSSPALAAEPTSDSTTATPDPNPPPKAQVSGGVLNGRAAKLVTPSYPPEARKARVSGSVDVQIVFDEQGKVIWARAISGHPLLRTVCEDAARQSTFPPMKLSGQPVKVRGVVVYNFVQ